MQDPTDNLTPLARAILKRDAVAAYTKLVVSSSGNEAALEDLEKSTPKGLCAGFVRDLNEAKCMLSGLWLWHDFLDRSHEISQSVHTPSGSFWHAIMHRREGDFGNAKYWYAKVTGHPILASMGIQASSVINPQPADKRLMRINFDGWNGSALVDLVQSVHESPSDPMHQVAVALQQLEWRVLFEHCAREAQM
jgi:hypothetical protein